MLIYIFSMLGLLLLSAFFSAAETAFSSLNKVRLRALADQGNVSAKRALALAENYNHLIFAILVGNNVVNIALASLGTAFLIRFLGAKLGSLVATIGITFVVLVFGEVSPKSLAKDTPERFAMAAAPVMKIILWLLTPFCWVFEYWQRLLRRVFKLKNELKISQEELLLLVEEGQQDGAINENEGNLLKNAIEFAEQEANDILTPRVKLAALEVSASREEADKMFRETRYSRLMVYQNNIDNIIGVLHQKNFYCDNQDFRSLRELITPVIFVPTNEKIGSLLRKLQRRQVQVAVVLDEFGGTDGIVTMEDVLEELVGEIWDESDKVVEPFRKISENVVLVDASATLDDFEEYFKIPKPDSDMVSLSGWVAGSLHGIPRRNDSFRYLNLKITVLAIEHRHVSLLEVRILPEENAAPENN